MSRPSSTPLARSDGDASSIFDSLLASIGRRASEIGEHPVVTHWPHVGAAYEGLVIVGQAVYGWPDQFVAAEFSTPEGREQALRASRARAEDPSDPLDWIATHRVRNSPFWSVARLTADAFTTDRTVPWYSRIAWVNLYPAAPDDPPGNPAGALREAQDPYVGELLRTVVDGLDGHTVLALVGPYWWPAGALSSFESLIERPRPLLRSGRIDGRSWVVGWHPGGASRRGWGPARYAELLVQEVRRTRSAPVRSRDLVDPR